MEINADKCRECKKCETICPINGICIDENHFSPECIKCYHCSAICPEQAIVCADNLLGKTNQNNIRPLDFELLMQQRRSHRFFSSQSVSPEILKEFIERMRFSPTASNMQSLHFTVITGKNKLKDINDLTISTLLKAYNSINVVTTPLIRLFLGKSKLHKMKQSKTKFVTKAATNKEMITYNAPALILIHSADNPVGMPCHDANIWTGMATLYAELLDLCTCINGYIVNAVKRNKKLKNSLQIPANHTLHSALLIGYPKSKFENRVNRNHPPVNFITD